MRMKKIMILAVAAIALAACSRTFDTHHVTEPAIGFGTWAEHLTKATVDNTFADGDDFAVYGNKDKTTPNPAVVFNGDVVSASGSPITWDYSNHRFWDTSYDSYTFYAVSPAAAMTGATTTNTATTGAFATDDLDFAGNDNDILVADKTIVLKDDGEGPAETALTYFNSYGTVHMVFNHAASLVDVHVKKSPALDDATVTISAFSLDNIKQTGSLSLAADDYDKTISPRTTVPDITVLSWSSSNPDSYLPADGVTPVYGDTDDQAAISDSNKKEIATDDDFDATSPAATPAGYTTLINNLIVVPQALGATGVPATSQKISLTYQIAVSGGDTNEYSGTLYFVDFDNTDDADQNGTQTAPSWAPGVHYIYYITIDAHEIKFSAEIKPWESTVSGYHYLVN